MAKRYTKQLTILEVAYHRNGISGEGFHAVRFQDSDPETGGDVMLGIVFQAPGHVAVLSVDKVYGYKGQEATVAFGVNSWRGDEYAPALRRAVAEFEKKGRP